MIQLLRRTFKVNQFDPFIDTCYQYILGREPDPEGKHHFRRMLKQGTLSLDEFIRTLFQSDEFSRRPSGLEPVESLHQARCRLVRQLPMAETIVDLGGAAPQTPAGALVLMGYPYRFETLTIVEPPRAERHEIYRDVCPDQCADVDTGRGVVRYLNSSMANLEAIASASVDLVFSGESFEHVTRDEGVRVVREVRRILKSSGSFCLDTPNRSITTLQTGEAYINPDHKYEYTHQEMVALLEGNGFEIRDAKGIAWMPRTAESRHFDGREMVENAGLYDDITKCYLLYYRCVPSD